jgi:hypothetical protein
MLAPPAFARSPLQLRRRRQQQQQTEQLQDKRPRLAHALAAALILHPIGVDPEPQRRDDFLALGAIEQIKSGN